MEETAPAADQSISFLSGASARGRARVVEHTQLQQFAEGDVIFSEGDPPSALYVIQDGAVDVVSLLMDGTEEVQRTLGPGRILGELGILGGHARTATAKAAKPSALWAIEREAFLELYESEPTVAVEIATSMAVYLLDADVIAEDLLFLNLEGRVAKRLLMFLDAEGRGVYPVTATDTMSAEEVVERLREVAQSSSDIQPYSNLETLALLSGGSQAGVAAILNDMQRRGLIITSEGNVIVIDEEGLERLASAR
ncbi:MAG TPA: Crp/Fnr family transcriptional regulator [Actinomycetota bacterium]|nr:Crp/Fnr family transcriptional regulator [Actinomycetota bacterium]